MKANEKVDLDRAEQMRREGMTYAEIGKVFGVSRQAVQAKLSNHGRDRRRYAQIYQDCPYAGLRDFMMRNKKMRITELCNAIGYTGTNNTRAKVRRMLEGCNVQLSLDAIRKLETLSGLPFAELFRRDDHA